MARVWHGVAQCGMVWQGMARYGRVWQGMGHDYPKKKANVRYGRVWWGMRGFGRVLEGLGAFQGGMGGYGTRFSGKIEKFPEPTHGVN